MKFIADVQDIQYGVAELSDLEEMAGLLADIFSRFEPLALAVSLESDDLRTLVNVFGRRVPDDAITIVARDRLSGKLVGAMLTDDFGSPLPEGIETISSRFEPTLAMLEGLDGQYRKTRNIVPGEILHLFMLAVDTGFGGKGIARNLVRFTLENGNRRGYKSAITEATGKVSQHVFNELGFEERFRVTYKEFSYQGKRPFESIAGHEAVILMERRLEQ